MVSKYIGETEKNLHAIFDAAEAGGVVLLFDEADALFGKRSEVRDSHDRYANIEVSYLLQRMESYRGLAILTTNMREALDTAFLRRLRFVVPFPFPDAAGRAEIWRRVFPPAAPDRGAGVEKLAQPGGLRRHDPQHRAVGGVPRRRGGRAGADGARSRGAADGVREGGETADGRGGGGVDVNVEIDELVLDEASGFDDRPVLVSAVERQLAALPGFLVAPVGRAVAEAVGAATRAPSANGR